MIKILIIEDEMAATQQLKFWLEQLQFQHQIVACIQTVAEAIEWFLTHEAPDLIFSDIQLADGNSFQIYAQIEVKTPIIFTTAFDEYALRAFKLNSIDYILKPIDGDSLKFSLEKFNSQQLLNQTKLNKLIRSQSFTPKTYRKSFLVHFRDRLLPLKTNEFAYFLIENGIVYGQLFDERRFVIDQKLEELESQLDPSEFIRANRQFILSRETITEIQSLPNSRASVKTKPESPFEITISKEKISTFKKWFQKF
jgi:two-component system, LytTR family, response regulator LytT